MRLLLHISRCGRTVGDMKHIILPLILAAAALPVQAACYADYKAKQDNPLRLAYGVSQIKGACTAAQAQSELAPALANDGWTLLTILGTFDETGLQSRKDAAGEFYLRY